MLHILCTGQVGNQTALCWEVEKSMNVREWVWSQNEEEETIKFFEVDTLLTFWKQSEERFSEYIVSQPGLDLYNSLIQLISAIS